MRPFLCLTMLMLAAAVVRAEDKPEAGKADAKPANLEVNLNGVLRPKPKDAPENVVALFINIPKKFDIIDERKAVNLYAKGEVVKVLQELAKEKSRADITGVIVEGGIQVTEAEAHTGKKKMKQAAKAAANAGDAKPGKAETEKTEPGKKTKASDEEF